MTTALEIMWDKLDAEMDWLMANSSPTAEKAPDIDEHKGRADGMAQFLFLLVGAHYSDIASLKMQAVKRWKMRQNTIPWSRTPGVAGYTMGEVQSGRVPDNTSRDVLRGAVETAPAPEPKSLDLTDVQIAGIKVAISSNIGNETVRRLYGITDAQIAQIVGS